MLADALVTGVPEKQDSLTVPLSISTDYLASTGSPEPYLQRIAEAGFSHVHWCHQWNTDFLYSESEIARIKDWLNDFDLQLLDLHASHGQEKHWLAAEPYRREAGIELVRNRIAMTAALSGRVIILHASPEPDAETEREAYWSRLMASLDALRDTARELGVRIAIENGHFDTIEKILSDYEPGFIGLCYDSGHGNIRRNELNRLDALKDRLISVHLHDNDGTGDQHNLLFSGTIDWATLAGILAQSGYEGCASMELSMPSSGIEDEPTFLAKAFETGSRFSAMVASTRSSTPRTHGPIP